MGCSEDVPRGQCPCSVPESGMKKTQDYVTPAVACRLFSDVEIIVMFSHFIVLCEFTIKCPVFAPPRIGGSWQTAKANKRKKAFMCRVLE